MRRFLLKSLSPVTLTLGVIAAVLTGGPAGTGDPVALQANAISARFVEPVAQNRAILQRRPPALRGKGALAFVRTELFFGTAKAEGEPVSEQEFRDFVDAEITPRFPDGLTLVKADGQFRGQNGATIKEDSYVLVLLYPVDSQKESSRSVNEIRRLYMWQHSQESVLRVDDPFLVWVSF